MMEITNQQVAGMLSFMGELLELTGDNPFKVRAFYRAADTVDRLSRPVSVMTEKELDQIPGIGEKIAKKIREIVETGTFNELEELKKGVPSPLLELLKLEGIGPKTVFKLWKKMNILTIDDLEKAAKGHRIRAIKGFGAKKEEQFLRSIALYRGQAGRMILPDAEAVVERVSTVLTPGTFEVAGSFRRGRSTIGDIDIVSKEPPSLLNPRLHNVAEEIIDEGDRRTSIRVLGKRVDIRYAKPGQFGSMLLYLTGSKPFNIKLRDIAIGRGYKLNEYGIEERETGHLHEFSTEEEMFSFLRLPVIPPEIREDWGELELALVHKLPKLISLEDVRCDLHVHSEWSDGFLSLGELAKIGEEHGYEYLLCSDHSATLGIAHGLDGERLKKQAQEIEQVNRGSSCHILQGVEVDILSDGTLGLPNNILAGLDIVIASIHSGFNEDRDIMTRRVIGALENENVDIIGHPTGRLLGRRLPFEIDIGRVIERAAETGTALECNASPIRLDLDDVNIKQAMERHVKIAVSTDMHHAEEFDNMRYGIVTARRGWCTLRDVLNVLPMKELLEWASL